MNEIKVFENPAFGQVRTVAIDNEPWFVGKDVAVALGYKESAKAVREHVDIDDRGVSEMDTPGGKQKITIINESGLYSLILSSKLPQAKEFKRWVTSEVLPSIRKTGGYIMGQEQLTDAELMAKALLVAAKTIELRDKKLKELEATLEQQKPAVLLAESIKDSDDTILIGEMAKILQQNGYPTGQKRLFATLRNDGYLISRRGSEHNLPTQRAMEMGLFWIKETTVTCADGRTKLCKTVKVTGKGQEYFLNRYRAEKNTHKHSVRENIRH